MEIALFATRHSLFASSSPSPTDKIPHQLRVQHDDDDRGQRGQRRQPAWGDERSILARLAVNITSGTTANGSCRLSTT